MSEKITSNDAVDAVMAKRGRTDFHRLDELTDDEIETAIGGDPDAAPMLPDEWFQTAQVCHQFIEKG